MENRGIWSNARSGQDDGGGFHKDRAMYPYAGIRIWIVPAHIGNPRDKVVWLSAAQYRYVDAIGGELINHPTVRTSCRGGVRIGRRDVFSRSCGRCDHR